MLNVVAIMGRLVADPRLNQTNSGKSVSSFRIACNRNHRNADGVYPADFIDIVTFGNTAEFVCRNFHKGSLIAVSGRLQCRNYQDRNGNNRTAVEVVANEASFAGEVKHPNDANDSRLDVSPSDQFEPVEGTDDLPF